MRVITIDGPASSGKGTVAKIIADKLGYHYLESGSIYRVLGLLARRNSTSSNDVAGLLNLIKQMQLSFNQGKIYLKNEDVTAAIRDEKVGMYASTVAKLAEVRRALLDFQRSFAKEPGLVTDGRDMGSVVFPDADLKVFLTATPEVRAKRRFNQLQAAGVKVELSNILSDVIARDEQDSKRAVAPLMHDASFKYLDNSDIAIDETIQQILSWFNAIKK